MAVMSTLARPVIVTTPAMMPAMPQATPKMCIRDRPSNSGTTSTPAASTGTTSTTTPPAGGSGETVTLATGGTSGTYYAYGGVMQTTLNPLLTTGQLNVTSTGASSANILEVADGNAQMSILQSDVLSYAHSGTDLFTEAETSSQWVAGLYNETVQIKMCIRDRLRDPGPDPGVGFSVILLHDRFHVLRRSHVYAGITGRSRVDAAIFQIAHYSPP